MVTQSAQQPESSALGVPLPLLLFLFFFKNSFIVLSFAYHTMRPFKMYSSISGF